ncbi:MAG: type II toxin-antitoxin system RatA family toxin [Hyphomicrobiales bacterium]
MLPDQDLPKLPRQHICHPVPWSATQMFDLVADAERYSEFMPGCRGVTVLSRRRAGEVEHLEATMRIGYRLIEERISCRVDLNRARLTINVENAGGPLRHLTNAWVFHAMADGSCEIEFDIDFELKSRALSFVLNGIFDRVFHYMVEALETRAGKIYGIPAQTLVLDPASSNIAKPG